MCDQARQKDNTTEIIEFTEEKIRFSPLCALRVLRGLSHALVVPVLINLQYSSPSTPMDSEIFCCLPLIRPSEKNLTAEHAETTEKK